MEIGIVKLSIKWNEMLVLSVIIKDMRAYIGKHYLCMIMKSRSYHTLGVDIYENVQGLRHGVIL